MNATPLVLFFLMVIEKHSGINESLKESKNNEQMN
jgi:hypothetical protein